MKGEIDNKESQAFKPKYSVEKKKLVMNQRKQTETHMGKEKQSKP